MDSTTQIAENHIHISRTLFREGMHAVEGTEYIKSIKKIGVCMLALFTAAAAWLLYTGGSLVFLLGEAVFLGTLLLWLAILLPCTKRNRKYKVMANGADHVPDRTTIFYPGRLSVTADSGKETIISYHDITGWQETKNLYILNCRNNINVLLDKKGFVSGDFHAIEVMLKSDNLIKK